MSMFLRILEVERTLLNVIYFFSITSIYEPLLENTVASEMTWIFPKQSYRCLIKTILFSSSVQS